MKLAKPDSHLEWFGLQLARYLETGVLPTADGFMLFVAHRRGHKEVTLEEVRKYVGWKDAAADPAAVLQRLASI